METINATCINFFEMWSSILTIYASFKIISRRIYSLEIHKILFHNKKSVVLYHTPPPKKKLKSEWIIWIDIQSRNISEQRNICGWRYEWVKKHEKENSWGVKL